MRMLLIGIGLVFGAACSNMEGVWETTGEIGADGETSSLSYYSDYFSFVGQDDQSRVFFALDNNRGQDGASWQAEHFIVLHDKKEGWIKLEGNGSYENEDRILEMIPDSPNNKQYLLYGLGELLI